MLRWINAALGRENRIAELKQIVRLQRSEIDCLKRQLTTCVDTLDRMTWQQRALGAEAKVVAESMRGPQ